MRPSRNVKRNSNPTFAPSVVCDATATNTHSNADIVGTIFAIHAFHSSLKRINLVDGPTRFVEPCALHVQHPSNAIDLSMKSMLSTPTCLYSIYLTESLIILVDFSLYEL